MSVLDVYAETQYVPNPAAGADFVFTVPNTEYAAGIVSVRAQLVTSSAVANRFVGVVVNDNAGKEIYRCSFDTAITASKTLLCTFTPAVTSIVGGVTNTLALDFPLPRGPYPPLYTIGSVTTAIDTGDQWSAIAAWYRPIYPE